MSGRDDSWLGAIMNFNYVEIDTDQLDDFEELEF